MFRWLILLVLCSAVSISAFHGSRARRDAGTIPGRSEALYSTGLLLLVAVGLIAANWWMLGWTILVFLFFRFVVIPLEEQHLLAKFGDRYRAYMKRTGRLGPRLTQGGLPA